MAEAPAATETPPCPLCASLSGGIVVGEKGRFGMPVRNIACERCALVYQSPRPPYAEMMRYYSGAYREHYGQVRYPLGDGTSAHPGHPRYQEALERWHSAQAQQVLALCPPPQGGRVLEVGCRHGRTLCILRDLAGVEVFGIEPGPSDAEIARGQGVSCFTGAIEEYDPGATRFEHIQLFHVLEHLYDPVAALLRLRDWLAPGGKLCVEVPNVKVPYGLLEENFFQNAHLMNLSQNTLTALLHRAGYRVLRAVDGAALVAVAEPDAAARHELPRPFAPESLPVTSETAEYIAARLDTYARLEKLRRQLRASGPTLELVQHTASVLRQPGFAPHTLAAVSEMLEFFVDNGAHRVALLLTCAAADGQTDPAVRQHFASVSERLARAVAS